MKDKIEPGEPAIGFSLDCRINDRRALVIQTYLPRDASQSEINELLDRCCQAADLLDVRYRLKDMKLILQKSKEELPIHEKKLVSYENQALAKHQSSGRRGDFQWKGAEATNRDQLLETVAAARRNIDKVEKAIVEAESELNGASSAANR